MTIVPDQMPREQRPRAGTMLLRQFLRSPLRTASIVPSSPALAELMTAPLRAASEHSDGDMVVVELGPGTGAFTSVMQRLTGPGSNCRHVAIELNPTLSAHIQAGFPSVDVVTGQAGDLHRILDERGIAGVDFVVSSLPWQAFAGAAGERLIGTVRDVLLPHGVYTQFTYTWTKWAPPARRQLRGIRAAFGHVEVSGTIWRNFPPALVYTARRAAPPR